MILVIEIRDFVGLKANSFAFNGAWTRGIMNVISHKYIFLSLSGILVAASIFAVAFWGLKFGIDFTGGSLLEVEFVERRPTSGEAGNALRDLGLGSVIIQPTGEKGMILRFREIDESTHQKVVANLQEASVRSPIQGSEGEKIIEKRFDAIGPTIGRELRARALFALLVAGAAIILYIAWAFRRVSHPVASWKYGAAAVSALLHDITIPTGLFAFLGYWKGVEIDALFITALLTIMGFSVHDTIVVFDRIRENLIKASKSEEYGATVNRSINETISRSINTSLTVLLVLGAIFAFGGETTRYFALALMVGVGFGTYSSIFVASPLLVLWRRLRRRGN